MRNGGPAMNSGGRVIPFVKASACGNDFLLIDDALAPPDIHEFTRRICDRHEGVGADGIEWMKPHFSADVEIRLINNDGSEAEISGNGTRCVAAFFCAQHGKERIAILTGAGVKICSLISRSDSQYEFEAEMGDAEVGSELVLTVPGARGQPPQEIRGIPVSMGNPHFVTFVRDFPANWQARGAEIQANPFFTHGVNVEFVSVRDRHNLAVRFFERGAGETQSSGTGSCASAAAAIAAGRAKSPVKVHAPGGIQTVRQEGKKVFLRGPARLVGRGEYFLN